MLKVLSELQVEHDRFAFALVHLSTGCKNRSRSCYFKNQPAQRWTIARNTCLNKMADLAIFPDGLNDEELGLLEENKYYSIGLIRHSWYWATKQEPPNMSGELCTIYSRLIEHVCSNKLFRVNPRKPA